MTEYEAKLTAKRSLYAQLASLEYRRFEEGDVKEVVDQIEKVHQAIKELSVENNTGPQGIF